MEHKLHSNWNVHVTGGHLTWRDTSWRDASWRDTSWRDTSWWDTSWRDTSWRDASWRDTSWRDTSWRDGHLVERRTPRGGTPQGGRDTSWREGHLVEGGTPRGGTPHRGTPHGMSAHHRFYCLLTNISPVEAASPGQTHSAACPAVEIDQPRASVSISHLVQVNRGSRWSWTEHWQDYYTIPPVLPSVECHSTSAEHLLAVGII